MVSVQILPGRFDNESNDQPDITQVPICIEDCESDHGTATDISQWTVDHLSRLVTDFGRTHQTKSVSGGRMWTV